MGKSTSSYKPQKRADGRWAIRLMVDGESVYIYGKTQSEVRDRLKTKLKEIEDAKSAKITDVLKSDKITVEQWARTCLETYSSVGVRNSTYGGYLSIINTHLSDRFGKMKLSEVTNACVQDFISKKARSKANPDGLGEKSLINIKNYLSLIFNQAIKNGILLRNPASGVKIPKSGVKETIALSVDEEHRLLEAARNYPRPIMFAVVFALYTGCRKGEILGLQWKDIDFDEGIIHISKQFTRQFNKDTSADNSTVLGLSEPKTKFSIRDVYMFDSFAKELKAYKDKMIEWKKENRFNHSEEDFVFVGTKNKPIEPRVFYKYYQEVMEIAGIEDANFHTLRHTFTTRCIENGMDILMVSRTLGHSNISTTLNKYSHLLPKHQKACMEKLEAIYY